MLNYYRYESKKNILFFAVLTVLSLILISVFLSDAISNVHQALTFDYSIYEIWEWDEETGKEYLLSPEEIRAERIQSEVEDCFTTQTGVLTFLLCVVGLYLPIRDFSFLHKKRSVDCFFALPLSHRKTIFTKLLLGLSTVLVYYPIVYLFSVLRLLAVSQCRTYFFESIVDQLKFFLLSLLFTLALYLFNAFIFSRANTVTDGVLWIIGYTFIGIPAAMAVIKLLNSFGLSLSSSDGSYFSSLTPLITLASNWGDSQTLGKVVSAVFCVIALAAGVLLVLSGGRRKAENVEQRSDSFFGYRTLIAVFTATTPFVFSGDILTVFFFISGFVLSCIYARTIKHRWKTILPMLIGFAGFLLISVVTELLWILK